MTKGRRKRMIDIQSPVIDHLKQLAKEKGSQKAAADSIGITPTHFSDVVNGKRNLSEGILEKIGFTKVIVHVKTPAVPDVVDAIKSAQAEHEHMGKLKRKVFVK